MQSYETMVIDSILTFDKVCMRSLKFSVYFSLDADFAKNNMQKLRKTMTKTNKDSGQYISIEYFKQVQFLKSYTKTKNLFHASMSCMLCFDQLWANFRRFCQQGRLNMSVKTTLIMYCSAKQSANIEFLTY